MRTCCRADEVIATDKEDLVSRVQEITGALSNLAEMDGVACSSEPLCLLE